MKNSHPLLFIKNLFGGIGSAIVALKRLNIAIQEIIHVEHDKVANHVYRWNHDDTYLTVEKKILMGNQSTDSSPGEAIVIKHTYYDTFEEFIHNIHQRNDLSTYLSYQCYVAI